jgi:hypothetical protein
MRMVKDFVEIADYSSLDDVIGALVSLRETLGGRRGRGAARSR